MNKTLLLRLAAPLQSWGVASKYRTRDTASEPTKSGVIGLLAAALGRGRDESIEDLAKLKFGVRVDQPGELLVDYQTALGKTRQKKDTTYETHRFYLSDAVFLVALEGDAELIELLADAVIRPYYMLSLGRRSCQPTGKLLVGVVDTDLVEALQTTPWQASKTYIDTVNRRGLAVAKLRLVCGSRGPKEYIQNDEPISYSWNNRQHGKRLVTESYIPVSSIYPVETACHDPFASLGGSE